jgi:hypothetical protein
VGQFWRKATQNGFTFLYSGYNVDEGPVRRDGGKTFSKISKKSLIERHPIPEKMLTAHFKENI